MCPRKAEVSMQRQSCEIRTHWMFRRGCLGSGIAFRPPCVTGVISGLYKHISWSVYHTVLTRRTQSCAVRCASTTDLHAGAWHQHRCAPSFTNCSVLRSLMPHVTAASLSEPCTPADSPNDFSFGTHRLHCICNAGKLLHA